MEERLTYLLDTNIILKDFENFLENHENSNVILSHIVLEELDNQKGREGEVGFLARKAVRRLFEIKKYGDLNDWIKLDNGNKIHIESNFEDFEWIKNNDDIILGCLSYCNEKFGKTILVTNDINMALKAESLKFESLQIDSKRDLYKNIYNGYEEVVVHDHDIDRFYKGEKVEIDIIPNPNEFIILKSAIDPKRTAVGIYIDGELQKPRYFDRNPSGMTPRNLEQKMAIELLMRDDIPVVTFTGTYGSSKTFTQLAVALDLIGSGKYNKILLVKPPMPLDKNLQIGYKKGTVFEKYINTLGSITSNLEALKSDKNDRFMNGVKLLEGYMSQGMMEIISIEDILGSSYNNCIILAEEMQLLTKENFEALLSRVGNSRIFINGDLKQGSRLVQKDPREMGLHHLIDVFQDSALSAHLTLSSIQRSEFVKELSERW